MTTLFCLRLPLSYYLNLVLVNCNKQLLLINYGLSLTFNPKIKMDFNRSMLFLIRIYHIIE